MPEFARCLGGDYVKVALGDTALRITDPINPSGDMRVFTADGGRVVFSLPRNGKDGSRAYEASGAGFSPDGRWVAYTHAPVPAIDRRRSTERTDERSGKFCVPVGYRRRKTTVVRHGTPGKNLVVVDPPNGDVEQAITDDEYRLGPSLSPSATRIASGSPPR